MANAKGCNTPDLVIHEGDATPFNHRKYLSLIVPGILVFIFLKVAFDVHRGMPGGFWVPPPPRRPPENKSTAISNDALTKLTSFVSRKDMGKMSFLQALEVPAHTISDVWFFYAGHRERWRVGDVHPQAPPA